VGCFVVFVQNAFAQETAPSGVAEVERVIVTGSHIPTAEETGPNPVDTYRPVDIDAVRQAFHRFRRRYQLLLREEIAHTVATPSNIEDELRHLISVVGG
jgi:hypothetical protein